MTIQELEQQLLDLDFNHRIHLLQVLAQSLSIAQPQAETQPRSLLDVIDRFRQNMSPEELDPNGEDIWQDVRDRSPVSSEPRW
jgi:hypothetical protein